MAITKQDVHNLATLARMQILDSEADSLTSEIDAILGYVSQIDNIATDAIQEVFLLRNVMREDVATNTSSQYAEALLSNAPAREGNMLKVKKILG